MNMIFPEISSSKFEQYLQQQEIHLNLYFKEIIYIRAIFRYVFHYIFTHIYVIEKTYVTKKKMDASSLWYEHLYVKNLKT